ncbi:MAG: hypothetical protein J5I59_06260 [Saprospiraceae bacterium]|nr:hypothetical protein [Saprospiraceae bacterium]
MSVSYQILSNHLPNVLNSIHPLKDNYGTAFLRISFPEQPHLKKLECLMHSKVLRQDKGLHYMVSELQREKRREIFVPKY